MWTHQKYKQIPPMADFGCSGWQHYNQLSEEGVARLEETNLEAIVIIQGRQEGQNLDITYIHRGGKGIQVTLRKQK